MHAVLKRSEVNTESYTPPSGIFDASSSHSRLPPTHHFVVLNEHHIVCAEGSAEDDAGHTLEAMDPLLPL